MLAGRGDQVVRRELVEELDVGHETRPGEDALEQVVAQEGVLGDPVGHRRRERVEVVDALPGEAPLAEQVLVDVGDGGRVRVDPGRPGEDPLERRSLVLRRKRRGDPRLEHAVAPGHPAGAQVEDRTVERMRDGPHEAPHRAPGQPRIGIEGDHVPHVRRWNRRGSAAGHDAGRLRPLEEGVELAQLAALALPADPAALGLVPAPAPVEEQESRAAPRRLAVSLIEAVDGRRRSRQELVVAGNMLRRGVEPVREQGEPHVAVAVGEVVHLEAADLGLGLGLAGEEHRHDDERSQRRRHASVEVEPRQRLRAEQVGDGPVDERDREVGGGREREDRDEHDAEARGADVPGERERDGQEDRRDDGKGPEVARRRGPDVGAAQPHAQRHPRAERALELEAPVGDQEIAGVPPMRRLALRRESGRREIGRREIGRRELRRGARS